MKVILFIALTLLIIGVVGLIGIVLLANHLDNDR